MVGGAIIGGTILGSAIVDGTMVGGTIKGGIIIGSMRLHHLWGKHRRQHHQWGHYHGLGRVRSTRIKGGGCRVGHYKNVGWRSVGCGCSNDVVSGGVEP